MSIISSLKIVMTSDATEAVRGLSSPLDKLREIESAADRASGAMGRMKGPESKAAGSSGGPDTGAIMGAQIGASLVTAMATAMPAALAPLQSIGTRIASQIERVGGTVTTLAAKIDASFKLPHAMQEMATWGLIAKKSIYQAIQSMGKLGRVEKLNRILKADPGKGLGSRGSSKADGSPPAAEKFARAEAGQKGLTGAVSKGQAAAKGFGREMLTALGVFGLGYKVVQFFSGGIKGAVDLNETVSKTQQVFGGATSAITGQADEMARKYGLVKGPLLDAASSFGLIAKGAGYSDAAAAKMANTMTMLAADASSFHNVPMSEALEKIRSGLAGQAEPLRAFGVFLTEDAVSAEALRLGLARTSKGIDESAKVTARASLIQRAMAVSTGDLDATASGAANQFRKAGGGIENFATAMGTALMPAVTSAIGGFNDFLTTIVEWADRSQGAITRFTDGIKSGFDFAGSVIRNFGLYWDIAVLQTREFVINTVRWIGTIPENLGIIGEYIANNWTKLIADGLNAVGALFSNLGKNIGEFAYAVWEFIKDPTKGFEFNFTPLLEGFKATADKLPDLIKPALVSMQGEIGAKFNEIAAKEAKRAEGLAKVAPRNRPDFFKPPGSTEVKDKNMFAAGLEGGSKDAYSAIVGAKGRQERGDDSIKAVAKNSAQQVQIAKDQLETAKAIQGALAGAIAVPLLSF